MKNPDRLSLIRQIHAKARASRATLDSLPDNSEEDSNETETSYLLEFQKDLAYLRGEQEAEFADTFDGMLELVNG